MIKKMIQLFYSPEIARTVQIHPKKKSNPTMFLTPLYLSLPPIENEIRSHPLSLSLSLQNPKAKASQ